MTRLLHCSFTVSIFSLLAVMAVSASAAPPARAPAGDPKSQPKGPAKPAETNPRSAGRTGGAEGTHAKGTINDFKSTKDSPGEDDTLIGTLSIKPIDKTAKTLSLRVHRDVEYKLGETKLDPETAPDLLWKGLYVSATFDAEHPTDPKKKAPTQKALKSLSIDAFEIEGTVVEIGEDFIVINGKPVKGDWPDVEAPKTGTAPLAKTIKPRALKLKTIEKVSRFLNKDLRATELGEFAKDEKVEAIVGIGKGKAQGLLLTLHPPVIDRSQDKNQRTAQQPRPVTPPPNKGGRQSHGG